MLSKEIRKVMKITRNGVLKACGGRSDNHEHFQWMMVQLQLPGQWQPPSPSLPYSFQRSYMLCSVQ